MVTWKVTYEWQGLYNEWMPEEFEVDGIYFEQAFKLAVAQIIGEEMPPETRGIRNLAVVPMLPDTGIKNII